MAHDHALELLNDEIKRTGLQYRQVVEDMIEAEKEAEEATYAPKKTILEQTVSQLSDKADSLMEYSLSLAESVRILEDAQVVADV